ncbi:hypothetical protein ABB37_03787 [Leptomonas pyrrhocoris]|uniref:Transmembrane protein n=1 Tax=Leptomonas pyrrhocoris TaxID=157538 RepID=A0A0M9G3D8_LEPPY|nr:hypothetical protein ABB37_03787 [Leptomonas pyrrhocoris]KPA81417.1 hypothetical protein ABB37_03787 [Leptomonas pyrrhocoris]|eukprot:XP_015659856.1 hypothetical protein ABB37_03787 [Leptomonas pyrrhocoris]
MIVVLAAAAAIFLLVCGAVFLYSSPSIVYGGFFAFAIGALLAGMSLSAVFSTCANLLLVTLSRYELAPSPPVVFLRSFLAAMGQPTLTGIIALSLVALIAMAASKVRLMVEEMDVLLRCHAAFAARSEQAGQ